ncbi:MAG TPA: isoaspartyl peptidase/L-asparaginase [Enhygromyxa sp.]|nr:isoaspartyl peptidase/L-asparaginase [Enhygromyxa sp.]
MRLLAPALASILASILALACTELPTVGEVPEPTVEANAVELGPLIVAHGGQGSPADRSDGPAAAVDRGLEQLGKDDDDPLAAAIAAIELLEDDPRFNAGTGANLRLDGRTIEADAAVMDDRERFGAVAGISGVRHPSRVAEAVLATPHLFVAGAGAQAFAQTLGLEARELATEQARQKLARAYGQLFAEEGPWASWDWRAHWNFEGEPPADLADALARVATPTELQDTEATKDTVGVVVRTSAGRYAAALSTGGTTLAIRGRVGDVPILGAGLYAGPHGAVAATGKGEAIMRERVAAEVYRLLARGETPNDAIRLAIRDITPEEGVGVIAVSERGFGAVATSQMAWAARDGEASFTAQTWVQRRER